ncbi:MAG: hypothetical protein HN348_16310 [Proteobacteria bacterium]|jgi:hypothetical protein|nr:hypothetical protein [Pseudomonadota bacterium]
MNRVTIRSFLGLCLLLYSQIAIGAPFFHPDSTDRFGPSFLSHEGRTELLFGGAWYPELGSRFTFLLAYRHTLMVLPYTGVFARVGYLRGGAGNKEQGFVQRALLAEAGVGVISRFLRVYGLVGAAPVAGARPPKKGEGTNTAARVTELGGGLEVVFHIVPAQNRLSLGGTLEYRHLSQTTIDEVDYMPSSINGHAILVSISIYLTLPRQCAKNRC